MKKFFLKYITIFRVLAVAATLIVVVSSSSKMIRSPLAKGDTSVYLHAAEVILNGGNIYATTQIPAEQGGSYYLYLPLLAILFVPFTFLPINISIVLWTLINVLLVFWSVKTFYEAMTGHRFFDLTTVERWVMMGIPILLTLRYLLHNLSYGQVNILILAMLVLALKYGRREHGILQGIWAGLAGIVKVTAVPFMFWLFIKEGLKTKAGLFAGVLLGAVLIPSLVVGFGVNLDYVAYWLNNIVLSDSLTASHVPGSINTSVTAVLNRLFGNEPAMNLNGMPIYFTLVNLSPAALSFLSKASQLLVLATLGYYAFRFRKSDDLYSRWGGAAFAFTMIPLFAPTAQKHYFVVLLPAYVFSVYVWHFVGNRDKWFRGLVAASAAIAGLGLQELLGETVSDAMFAAGALPLGTMLLAAAIFRAAQNGILANEPITDTVS
ncbi:MAG: DUF2029 domain-containing protein [Acidobacteriota bacterium]|nr:MAG: DUF2029 domain-containing protein [Acidobacteriota bacterium]